MINLTMLLGLAVIIIITIIVHSYRLYYKYLSEQMTTQKDQETDSSIIIDPSNWKIDGVFEVHITINPKDNYVKLLRFIEDKKLSRKIKIVFAVSEVGNNQYMISYFTQKDDDKLAVEFANNLASELERDKIDVVRVKIESHNTKNMPLTDKDYYDVCNALNLKYDNKCGKSYFEFHCKVETIFGDLLDLENHVSKHSGCALSYNLCSNNKKPILTIRVYNVGFDNAKIYKDTVMNDLKKKGHTFEDKIQQEFSIFDSNSELDNNWINVKFKIL